MTTAEQTTRREFGTVVRFIADRIPPFAFIRPDEIGNDVFLADRAMREAGIVGPVEPGTRLSYETRQSKKWPERFQAWNVMVEPE
jgi:cold shock CspA family protein